MIRELQCATRRLVLLALFLMTGGSIAEAQGIAHSFDELKLLVRPGGTVSVIDALGREATGKIVDVSMTGLVLMVESERRELHESDVTRVLERRRDSLVNGAIFGAAIGGGLGLIGANRCANDFGCSGTTGEFLALWGGIGVGAGVGVDALIAKRRVIYERRPSLGASVRISPMLGRERKGVLVSMAF
jgi:hypothetical protein